MTDVMIRRILDERTERAVTSCVHISITVALRYRHRYHVECSLEEIAAFSGAGNARIRELRDLYEARVEAWRDLYGGSADTSSLAYDRLCSISKLA